MSTDTRLGDAAPRDDEAPAGPWYRRRGTMLAAGVVAVLAVAVLTDLPSPGSRAGDLAAANAFVKEVNTDLRGCGFAVREAFGFRQDQLNGTLSTSDRSTLPSLLTDDEVACSYANPSISDLTSIESPGTAADHPLGDMLATAQQWTTYDALGAIDAIALLSTHPTRTKALAALARDAGLLASDRASARAAVAQADAALHARVFQVDLPGLPPASVVVPGGAH